MRWKEGKARYMIGENSASSGVFVFSPSNLPHQPLSKPLFVPFVSVCLFLCSHSFREPRQLGTDSDRAPCSALVSCVCHVLLPNISLLFPADPPFPTRFGRFEHLYFLVCTPARFCLSVCPTCLPTFSHVT